MWNKKIKKTIFTLALNNWQPKICEITFPLMKAYAEKIGAEFYVIDKRKFPEWKSPTYEKFQIYELGKEMNNDWNIYIDADALVHPEMLDVTVLINKDTVMHNGCDMANIRWKYDRVFLRDGRHIGSCNWFTVGSDWCIDLWKPLDDLTQDEAYSYIYPTVEETNTVITKEHLIDDYVCSRNIAKYGLKYIGFADLLTKMNMQDSFLLWHQYTMPPEQKLTEMKKILKQWNLI